MKWSSNWVGGKTRRSRRNRRKTTHDAKELLEGDIREVEAAAERRLESESGARRVEEQIPFHEKEMRVHKDVAVARDTSPVRSWSSGRGHR